jgi:hypothetical protein
MFIIARSGHTRAELHWRQGGPASIPLNVEVDYSQPFDGSDFEAWHSEYDACVAVDSWQSPTQLTASGKRRSFGETLDSEFASLFADPPPF